MRMKGYGKELFYIKKQDTPKSTLLCMEIKDITSMHL